jgi:hypothetical protein
MKYICLASLILVAALRLTGIASHLCQFAVCGGATFVMTQAARSRKHLWGAAFALTAIYFNPVIPITFSRSTSATRISVLRGILRLGVSSSTGSANVSGHDYRPARARRGPLTTALSSTVRGRQFPSSCG